MAFCAFASGVACVAPALPTESEAKVLNGAPSDEGAYPFIVALQYSDDGVRWRHWCGATLLDDRTALTAAHCVDRVGGEWGSNLRLVAGSVRLDSEARQVRAIDAVAVHADYQHIYQREGCSYPPRFRDIASTDVALVRVSSAFELVDGRVEVAELVATRPVEGTHVTVAGWGYLSMGRAETSTQQFKSAIVASEAQLIEQDVTDSQDFPSMIYALNPNGDGLTCGGDSGGPLLVPTGENADGPNNAPSRWQVAGTLSYSFRYGRPCTEHVSVYRGILADDAWLQEARTELAQFDGVGYTVRTACF